MAKARVTMEQLELLRNELNQKSAVATDLGPQNGSESFGWREDPLGSRTAQWRVAQDEANQAKATLDLANEEYQRDHPSASALGLSALKTFGRLVFGGVVTSTVKNGLEKGEVEEVKDVVKVAETVYRHDHEGAKEDLQVLYKGVENAAGALLNGAGAIGSGAVSGVSALSSAAVNGAGAIGSGAVSGVSALSSAAVSGVSALSSGAVSGVSALSSGAAGAIWGGFGMLKSLKNSLSSGLQSSEKGDAPRVAEEEHKDRPEDDAPRVAEEEHKDRPEDDAPRVAEEEHKDKQVAAQVVNHGPGYIELINDEGKYCVYYKDNLDGTFIVTERLYYKQTTETGQVLSKCRVSEDKIIQMTLIDVNDYCARLIDEYRISHDQLNPFEQQQLLVSGDGPADAE